MRATAHALGLDATVKSAWGERNYGDWSGVSAVDLDPAAVSQWIQAPHHAPPRGEPTTDVVRRIEARLGEGFGEGIHLVVSSAEVLRATIMHITSAPLTAYHCIDVGPLDALEITLNGARRAIRSLRPYPDWL